MSGSGDSRRAIFFALGANLAIALAKGAAALATGSGAMLAETVHSLADCGNQLLLLLGMRQAKRPASAEYPLGYGRAIYFWSFLVAVMLFCIGGMFSVYEGVHKLLQPEPLSSWGWAVGVLGFALVAEGVSLRSCLQEIAKVRGGRSLWTWFRESRQAELIVIFGEDLAALLGLALALAAVLLTVLTGNPLWDALGTIAIGALLIVVAVLVAIQIKAMLIGQSVDPAMQRQLHAFLQAQPQIERVIHLVAVQLGEDVMVSVQATLRQKHDAAALLADITCIERGLKQQFPTVRWSFFEPEPGAAAVASGS
ncbi:cation diffusion facilitator family transporter [Xanthomonas cerealis]|uniref:Cation diffusion facilitator family transporter n=1 Tax=Xanthomonas cerealis pv. cerealis TaxID=152263 RepID=A0A514EA62_9XANT|nr:cation diffusion facilitator family transporter [Xanthomonas translucens]QDI02936.1 cation diffusion facilitator family transporter [Xanthomonas translucens pv. cerealis]UKE48323.1 cation diffusion facilitator family transporter [Xanthomonas translucens pv. cerealis]